MLIQIILIKYLSNLFIEIINEEKTNEHNLPDYSLILSQKLPQHIVVFILWTQDQKNCCFEKLKTTKINLTSEEYDLLTDVLKPHEGFYYKAGLNGKDKKSYIQEQKEDFFSIQSKFSLLNDLSHLKINSLNPKKIKL